MAQTANEKILSEYVKHQTYLLRFAGGLGNTLADTLAADDGELNDTLLKWLAKVEDRSLANPAGKEWQADFEKAITTQISPAWDEVEAISSAQLEKLGLVEAEAGAAIIQSAVPVVLGLQLPPTAQLTAIVNSQPLEGRVLKDWLAKAKQSNIDSVVTNAKAGIIQGLTPSQVARNIMGTEKAGFKDGAARKKATRELNSLVRTITNGVQTEAKQALYEANSDIIKNELFVATLDSRTTFVCAGNDGQTFPRGEGPMTPLHFGCRSLRVPYINADNLGDRPFNPTTEKGLLKEYSEQSGIDVVTKRDKLPRGHKTKYDEFARKRKRELIGQTPAKTSYSDWLKGQSKEFQDEYLGPARAELFRTGQIKLDKFSANDGSTLTLDQLVEKSAPAAKPTKSIPKAKVATGAIISRDIRKGDKLGAANKMEAERHVALTDGARPIIATLPDANRSAIKAYVEDQAVYESLNEKMRNGEVLPPDLLKVKQNLDEALNKQSTPIDRLYRGDRSLPATREGAKALVGKTLRNDGYTSTSLAPRTAAMFGGRFEEIGEGKLPGDAYPTTILEFNTEGRPPRGLYVTANSSSAGNKATYDEAKTKGVISDPFYETEYLIGSGKRYKIVGLREELVYNEDMYDGAQKQLVYEAVFLD